jgi:hypothetical protein
MGAEFGTVQLDLVFKKLLDIEGFAGVDSSMNGIQVDNDGGAVRKIAFAVDASMETFERAAAAGAGMLFVHHGLFWGAPLRLAGNHRRRAQFLLDHNICLYAAHLPLDQSPRFGNNICLAQNLELRDIEPFGLYHGRKIGWKGVFPQPLTIDEAVKKCGFLDRPPAGIFFPLAKRRIIPARLFQAAPQRKRCRPLRKALICALPERLHIRCTTSALKESLT